MSVQNALVHTEDANKIFQNNLFSHQGSQTFPFLHRQTLCALNALSTLLLQPIHHFYQDVKQY